MDAAENSSPTETETLTVLEDRLRRSQELAGVYPFAWEIQSYRLAASPALMPLLGFQVGQEPTFEGLLARVDAADQEQACEALCVTLEPAGY